MNFRDAAVALRTGAKLYQAFKDGEELASQMDQGEHAMANLQSAISTLQKEYDQLRVAVEAAKSEASVMVRDAQARADGLVAEARERTIPAERTALLADAIEAQQKLRRSQEIWEKTQMTQAQTLTHREQEVSQRETRAASREHDLATEAARVEQAREAARQALAKVSA